MQVREATVDELPNVLAVLDAAALETDAGSVRSAIDAGEALVAVTSRETVVGTLVLDGEEITAIAVRPRRRDQGIGRALVDAAGDRRDRLVAEFDGSVRPFYDRLGFSVERLARDGRWRGHWPQ